MSHNPPFKSVIVQVSDYIKAEAMRALEREGRSSTYQRNVADKIREWAEIGIRFGINRQIEEEHLLASSERRKPANGAEGLDRVP